MSLGAAATRFRWPIAGLGAIAVCGPDVAANALAATAGSLFEAAPFLLLAPHIRALLGRHERCIPIVALLGCGCTRGAVPGALSFAAVALTWVAFGPLVALLRVGAATLLVAGSVRLARRVRPHRSVAEPALCAQAESVASTASAADDADVFADLESIAIAACATTVAVATLGPHLGNIPPLVQFACGTLVGMVAPCAVSGIAIAMGLGGSAAPAAIGVLVTSGLVTLPRHSLSPHVVRCAFRLRRLAHASDVVAYRSPRTTRLAAGLLAGSLAALAFRGPSGLVNPRLCALIAVAALPALLRVGRDDRTRATHPLLVGAVMLAALVHAVPPVAYHADVTQLADTFAGETLAFTGVVEHARIAPRIARFAITCCRLDASRVGVRLDRPIPYPDGTWVRASGVLIRSAAGTLVLHPATLQRTVAPDDPFLYR